MDNNQEANLIHGEYDSLSEFWNENHAVGSLILGVESIYPVSPLIFCVTQYGYRINELIERYKIDIDGVKSIINELIINYAEYAVDIACKNEDFSEVDKWLPWERGQPITDSIYGKADLIKELYQIGSSLF